MGRKLNARRARRGFTLIELMIVMVILAIAAAMVVPMASSAGSMQVRAAGNMVAADLEYAKSMAISRGQKYSVVFDTTNETYKVTDQNGNTISHPVKQGFLYTVNFRNDNDSRLNQVDIATVSFDGSSAVSFDYLGSPYSGTGGSVAPLNSGVITLQAGGVTKTVNVEPVTGYISVN
jgi:general secretion pathway protein H